MEILDVRLEMLGQHVDALGEERHLDLGGSGVGLGALVLRNDARLVSGSNCHGWTPTLSVLRLGKRAILARNGPQTQAKSGNFASALGGHEPQGGEPRASARAYPEESPSWAEDRHLRRGIRGGGEILA